MITLITGAPGAGKTAAMVDILRGIVGERPLYVQGVNGLQLDHELVDATRWHEDVPDGAVIVIDEVQQVWRPRGPSVKPGPDIQSLETHRHRGLDFYLTTQQPKLLDQNVRALVGRHVHIRDTGWLGRWWYEWPECSENLAWKTCSIKKRYKLPRKAFDLYTSASMHMTPKRIGSPMLWITGILVVLGLVLSAAVYRTVTSKFDPVTIEPVETPGPGLDRRGVVRASAPMSAAELLAERVPRLPAEPETAPMYDHLRVVRSMPRIVGGYCVDLSCRCITDQGTDPGITMAACREWILKRPYNPYAEPFFDRGSGRNGRNRDRDRQVPPATVAFGDPGA